MSSCGWYRASEYIDTPFDRGGGTVTVTGADAGAVAAAVSDAVAVDVAVADMRHGLDALGAVVRPVLRAVVAAALSPPIPSVSARTAAW